LIVRYDELSHAIKLHDIERRQMAVAKARLNGAIRDIYKAIAIYKNQNEHLCRCVKERLDRITDMTRNASSTTMARTTRICLRLFPRVLSEEQNQPKTICRDASNDTHIQNTTPYPNVIRKPPKSDIAQSTNTTFRGTALETNAGKIGSAKATTRTPRTTRIALEDVVRAFPALGLFGRGPIRSWSDLERLTPDVCRYLGVSINAYHRAQETTTQLLTSMALSLTLEKTERQEISGTGGYLRALTDRAQSGELRLHHSVRGLLRQNFTAETA
jgi:hypothetical protein